MIPLKIINWFEKKAVPQRLILFGSGADLKIACEIAGALQNIDGEKIRKGGSEDVIILRDDGESIKIGDSENPETYSIRSIIKWATQKAALNCFRIVIIENFERAGINAQNAILKIVEEPPSQAVFIFTTKNPYRLLPTILSRMVNFPIIEDFIDFVIDDEIVNFLGSTDLISKFKKIEELDELSKKQKSRKPFLDFLEKNLAHARFYKKFWQHLEQILKTQNAIEMNQNPRFSCENLAINIS
jgi:DNA polymerase III delta prime subunit